MDKYPNITRALKGIGTWLIGCVLPMGIGYYLGVHKGQEIGRHEMQCVFVSVFENIKGKPAPGTVTIGCEKRGSK